MLIHRQHIRNEKDIVSIRDRIRMICEELGFGTTERLQITTSVFEMARNIVEHGDHGRIMVEMVTEGDDLKLIFTATDSGPGMSPEAIAEVLDPSKVPARSTLRGFEAMRRFMDRVEIENNPEGGLIVKLVKKRAGTAKTIASNFVEFLAERFKGRKAPTAGEELRLQNINLAQTLSLYQDKAQELERQNKELAEVKRQLEEANQRLRLHAAELQENLLGLGDETADLASDNQRLIAAIHALQSPILMTDPSGNIVFANEAMVRMLEIGSDVLFKSDSSFLLNRLVELVPDLEGENAKTAWIADSKNRLKTKEQWSCPLKLGDRLTRLRVVHVVNLHNIPLGWLWVVEWNHDNLG